MTKVDAEMQSTLKKITKEALYYYPTKERTAWIAENLGMVAISGS